MNHFTLNLGNPHESICKHEHMAKTCFGNYLQSFPLHQLFSVRRTAAVSPEPLPAAPLDSTGACERGPRWLHSWGRCSSRGWGRWLSRRRLSACVTGTPLQIPRSAYRSHSSPRTSRWSWCLRGRRGCWRNSSPWSCGSFSAEWVGWVSTVLLLLLSLGPRCLRGLSCECRTASPAVWPGSCSRATCRSSPPRGGARSGPRRVALLSFFGGKQFVRLLESLIFVYVVGFKVQQCLDSKVCRQIDDRCLERN